MFIECAASSLHSAFMRKRKGDTHPTFAVLEKAAKEFGISGPTKIGAVFGVGVAVVNNWRTRGVPEQQKVLASVAFQIPLADLAPEGLDDLDLSHLKRHAKKNSFAAGIQAERDLDPYALIAQGLDALVILEEDQQEVMKQIKKMAEKSKATSLAWQAKMARKTIK